MADNRRDRRASLRLQGFDYAQSGVYFVTICVKDRKCLFGEVAYGGMVANRVGAAVGTSWSELPEMFPGLALDAFVVMPNHLHGLVVFDGVMSFDLSAVIQAYKSLSTRGVNAMLGSPGGHLWHRGFYEHIVRNDADLDRIRQYIAENPIRWALDEENPARSRAPGPSKLGPYG